MSIESSNTEHQADHRADRTSETEHLADANEATHLTTGIVSLVLGLTALMGGGSLTTVLQFWTIRFTSDVMDGGNGYRMFQALNALPVVLLGVVAVVLGLVAGKSSHLAARAIGRAGAITGALAIVSGVLVAVLSQSVEMY